MFDHASVLPDRKVALFFAEAPDGPCFFSGYLDDKPVVCKKSLGGRNNTFRIMIKRTRLTAKTDLPQAYASFRNGKIDRDW